MKFLFIAAYTLLFIIAANESAHLQADGFDYDSFKKTYKLLDFFGIVYLGLASFTLYAW